MRNIIGRSPASLLELGSGGGNNASHYKAHIPDVVLSDRSEEMLALSRTINSELEHIQGDMRTPLTYVSAYYELLKDSIAHLELNVRLNLAKQTRFDIPVPYGKSQRIRHTGRTGG